MYHSYKKSPIEIAFTKRSPTFFLRHFFTRFDYLLIFFAAFFVYLLTTYPSVPTEDAGELIVSAIAPDVAHPPGYPTYILIGKLFSIFMPFGNMAWRINVMSGFFGAMSSAFLYLILKKSLQQKQKTLTVKRTVSQEHISNDFIAMATSLFFAFGNIVWSQSNRAEVYTLNTFFLALTLYLLYSWHVSCKKGLSSARNFKTGWLCAAALIYGLSLGNHHLMFLAAPPILLFVLLSKWRIFIKPKIIACSILALLLGLSVYAYLPIRTYLAPYDNPAYIEHPGLYGWDSFFSFVNRKIYGGTVSIDTETITQEGRAQHLPSVIIGIRDFFINYGSKLVNNNKTSFLTLIRLIIKEYFYIPLLFFIPGLYFLLRNNWRWGVFISGLFLSYTSILLVFVVLEPNADVFSYSSEHPFFIPVLFITAIIIGNGFAWLKSLIRWRKMAMFFSMLLLFLPLFAIYKNFAANNESRNWIAHDFNRNLLESMPENAYLISTGRDNMTFPLYYLRKIEGVRKDVRLEIYYSTAPVDENYLKNKLADIGAKAVFIDLLPPNYHQMNLKPYNYVYQYGGAYSAPSTEEIDRSFKLRGARRSMDYPNNRLKGLHYIKLALLYENNRQKRNYYFDKVIDEVSENTDHLNFIGDYSYGVGDYAQAIKAYKKAGNGAGQNRATNRRSGLPDHENYSYRNGMT